MRITVRCRAWLVVCGLLICGLLHAAPLWWQDFEGQLSGEIPKGWGRAWGDQGDDLLLINNRRSVSGKVSLMLDRQTGTNEAMWGMATTFPDVKEGWAVLSFAVLVQGTGDDARFGFEIRSRKQENLLSLGMPRRGGREFIMQSGDRKQEVSLGEYREDCWHRFRLWLPTAGGGQAVAYGVMERLEADGAWTPLLPPRAVAATPPVNAYGLLRLNVAPGKRNYLVFLDDCQLEQQTEAPAE